MITEESNSKSINSDFQIANFWRRIFALAIDSIVLGLLGMCLGLFLGDYFSDLGAWGRFIGFFIALTYYTIFNSRFGQGQTVGKTLVKIKVVSSRGELLGLNKSFLRASIFCIPFFLNGAQFSQAILQSWFIYPLSIAVFGCIAATLYLYIFNRKTRQTLHDLAVGSYVVNATSPSPARCKAVIWRGHYLVVVIALVVAGLSPVFTGNLAKSEPYVSLLPLQAKISKQPDVKALSLNVGSNWFKSFKNETETTTTYLTVNVWTNNNKSELDAMANGIAEIILNNYAAASTKDLIVITIVRGFDIGIASNWSNSNFSFPPRVWLQRINSRSPNAKPKTDK